MVGKERVIKRVTDFSKESAKEYKLRRIYLFGSLAGGLFLKSSDIDIAVEGMDFEDYLRALAEHRQLKGIHLDILHLDFCRPKLKEAIVKERCCMKKSNNGKILIETLIKNIRQEIFSIDEIYLQIEPLIETIDKAHLEEKAFYNRAAGSILHDFYTCLEKIFCDVANKIDSGLPKQEDWHIRLLKSMAQDSNKRPKVIPLKSMQELKEYLALDIFFTISKKKSQKPTAIR